MSMDVVHKEDAVAKERVLVLVDPVSCGEPALERALTSLHPDRHELTISVIARAPLAGDADDPYSADFAFADSALALYRRKARAAGFAVDGWVTPDRREQMMREVRASEPFDRALAVSPSGTWRRLLKRDVSHLLEAAGVDTSLACAREEVGQ